MALQYKDSLPTTIEAQNRANYADDGGVWQFGGLKADIIGEAIEDGRALQVTPGSEQSPGLVPTSPGPVAIVAIPTNVLPTAVIAEYPTATAMAMVTTRKTPSPTPTPIPTFPPTHTPTVTLTPTPTTTPYPTWTATVMATVTAAATFTPAPTVVPTAIPTNSPPNTATFTPLPPNTPTFTPLPPNTPTFTPLPPNTPTFTPLPTNTPTATATPIPSSNEILFVVRDSAGLNTTDTQTLARLTSRGFTVTVLSGSATFPSDTVGKAVVYISSSIDSKAVGDRLRDVPVPIVVSESYLFDNMDFTGATLDVDYGLSANDQDSINILNSSHQLAAGLSGVTQVYTGLNPFHWGAPAPTAIIIAELVDGTNRNSLFAYESGTSMNGGFIAPARRVAFIQVAETNSILNSNGWALFDAAIDWAMGS